MKLFESITKLVFVGVNATYDQSISIPSNEFKVAPPFEIHSNNPTKAWVKNQDLITGLKFRTTMQFRTPLRVLKRRGEIHSDINTAAPQIAHESWEGIWTSICKTYRELGIDIDEMPEDTVASHIGQIKASEYLPFLVSVREIVELNESIETRINKLRAMPMTGSWGKFVNQHGGIDKIINEFFPRFIDTIPKLNIAIVDELSKLDILMANQVDAASDNNLLNIPGIGKAKLKSTRDYCASVKESRDQARLDQLVN